VKRNAFTIIELLAVVVIIAVVSAVTFPVIFRSKQAAKVAAAKVNLKNYWVGLNLYQSDHDSPSEFGETYEMGLPRGGAAFTYFCTTYMNMKAIHKENSPEHYPCGLQVNDEPFVGIYYFGSNLSDWKHDVLKYENKTVLLADKNCNSKDVRIMCQFCSKRSIGISIVGQILDRTSSEWHFYDQRFYLP
jgi:prepilin-type N-terminal cleavage/methylation domain-containing protein